MNVGLIDVDGSRKFPNLPLMKISAFHKQCGDTVEWANPFEHYDLVYQTKVFDETYSRDIGWFVSSNRIIKGGTGYVRRRMVSGKSRLEFYVYDHWQDAAKYHGDEIFTEYLPDEIEHIYPDYELYPEPTKDTAYGFLTRGCPNRCGFCCVSSKEGCESRKVADLSEFWRGQKYIKLLDPNLLMCSQRIELLNQLAESNAWIDFTQGLDIRAVNREVVEQINRIKLKEIHFAWDIPTNDLVPRFRFYAENSVRRPHGNVATVYVLTNFHSTLEEDLYRIYTLRDMGYLPDVRVYDKPNAPKVIRDLQRWCNNRRIFKTTPRFEDYRSCKGESNDNQSKA